MVSRIDPIVWTPSLRQAAADRRLMDLEVRITKFLKEYTASIIANDTEFSNNTQFSVLYNEARAIELEIEIEECPNQGFIKSVQDEKLDDFRLKMSAAFLTYQVTR